MSMKTNFDTVYVHYGSDTFNRAQVALSASHWNKASIGKPNGLWASPVDAKEGWKDWCEGEDFNTERLDKSFKFKLTKGSRILEIHQIEDILFYVISNDLGWRVWIGFESMCVVLNRDALMTDFDGMELYLSENYKLRDQFFYSWDCDSICIWNPDVIEVIKEEEKE